MKSDFLKANYKSQAGYVDYGYGQVEPNHLSAQRTAQIYAQLPADSSIKVLEQGQFVKYDYVAGLVNFGSEDHATGEWMMVYNEIKLYRDHQDDCEFAMVQGNYQARVYSPYGEDVVGQSRFYNGVDAEGNDSITVGDKTYKFDDVTAPVDPYEIHYNEDPYHILNHRGETRMPEGTTMVPRVFKTNVGDIMTTNTIADAEVAAGDILSPNASGILAKDGDKSIEWQVAKLTTMPDGQKAVKLVRIK
jgi:hypothetical protein